MTDVKAGAARKPLILAAAAVAAVVVLVVVLALVHAAQQRERACEFEKAMEGYTADEATALCS